MKIQVCGKLGYNEEGSMFEPSSVIIPVNRKGCEEVDIDTFNDLTVFSSDKSLRLIGLNKKGLYKMTLKSWKALRKTLLKNGQMYLYN